MHDPASTGSGSNTWPGDAPWRPLPDAARRSFLIGNLIWSSLLGVVVGPLPSGVVAFAEAPACWQLLWAAGGFVGVVMLGIWRARVVWRTTRWWLDDDGLRVRRGVWWRSETLVPRARVQHLDIERGPIERHFGLATLVVHTAGTRLSALRQPGFDEQDAEALRQALVPRTREHDDEPVVTPPPTHEPPVLPNG